MSGMDQVKRYFFENAGRLGLNARRPESVRAVTFSRNANEYGMQNHLIGDKKGFKYILKKSRSDEFDSCYRKRMRKLHELIQDEKYGGVGLYIMPFEELDVYGETFTCFKFVDSRNSDVLMRSDIFRRKSSFCVEKALEFCVAAANAGDVVSSGGVLEKIRDSFRSYHGNDPDVRIARNRAFGGAPEKFPDVSISIVHNDLVPENLIIQNGSFWLVDWEYWGVSLSFFNYFDVLTSFWSTIETSSFSRRTVGSFLSLFQPKETKRKEKFVRTCGRYAERMGCGKYSPDEAELLFYAYLKNKSICQQKTYGADYGFDSFWYSVLKEFAGMEEGFRSFWNRLAGGGTR